MKEGERQHAPQPIVLLVSGLQLTTTAATGREGCKRQSHVGQSLWLREGTKQLQQRREGFVDNVKQGKLPSIFALVSCESLARKVFARIKFRRRKVSLKVLVPGGAGKSTEKFRTTLGSLWGESWPCHWNVKSSTESFIETFFCLFFVQHLRERSEAIQHWNERFITPEQLEIKPIDAKWIVN